MIGFSPSKRHARLTLALSFALAGFVLPGEAAKPKQLIIKAKVRDFKEVNAKDTANNHPHFNSKTACGPRLDGPFSVEPDIDTTQSADGGLYEGDHRGPRLLIPVDPALGDCFSPDDRFSDWYQDKNAAINRSFRIELRFELDTVSGLYRFSSDNFFPVDSNSAYSKFKAGDPDPFGHLLTGTVSNLDISKHNYGFTMEFHNSFQYLKGKNQAFVFEGDDDVWVFMNNKRVIDLGGVHEGQGDTVNLDSLATTLGLQDSGTYPLDFFFAERKPAQSRCVITTSLELTAKVSAVATPTVSPADTALTGPIRVALGTITDSAKIYYTLDGSAPDESKLLYADSITVQGGTTLKAIAYRPGWISSEVLTFKFLTQETVGLRGSVANRAEPRSLQGLRFKAGVGPVQVRIFDRSGKVLRTLFTVNHGKSEYVTLHWDGIQSTGRKSAPGVYYWKAEGNAVEGMSAGKVLAP